MKVSFESLKYKEYSTQESPGTVPFLLQIMEISQTMHFPHNLKQNGATSGHKIYVCFLISV